jgi:hypothetical protein
MPDATIAVDVLPAAPSGALRLGLKDAWFLVGWDAASGFDCQQSCQTQTYLVLARFWCKSEFPGTRKSHVFSEIWTFLLSSAWELSDIRSTALVSLR